MKIYKDMEYDEENEEYWEISWWKFMLHELFGLVPSIMTGAVNGFLLVIISLAFAGAFAGLLEKYPDFVSKVYCQSYLQL